MSNVIQFSAGSGLSRQAVTLLAAVALLEELESAGFVERLDLHVPGDGHRFLKSIRGTSKEPAYAEIRDCVFALIADGRVVLFEPALAAMGAH